jgi:hypothetical protein
LVLNAVDIRPCIGKFLYDNYVQALRNVASLPEHLALSMKLPQLTSEHTFTLWHQAEWEYLSGLKHESDVDMLLIEYLLTLIKLKAAE